MLNGWWTLLHSPRAFRQLSIGDGEFFLRDFTRRSVMRPVEKQQPDPDEGLETPISGVLPSPTDGSRNPSLLQPGDVAKRHETTRWFEEEGVEKKRVRRGEVVDMA